MDVGDPACPGEGGSGLPLPFLQKLTAPRQQFSQGLSSSCMARGHGHRQTGLLRIPDAREYICPVAPASSVETSLPNRWLCPSSSEVGAASPSESTAWIGHRFPRTCLQAPASPDTLACPGPGGIWVVDVCPRSLCGHLPRGPRLQDSVAQRALGRRKPSWEGQQGPDIPSSTAPFSLANAGAVSPWVLALLRASGERSSTWPGLCPQLAACPPTESGSFQGRKSHHGVSEKHLFTRRGWPHFAHSLVDCHLVMSFHPRCVGGRGGRCAHRQVR